MAFREIECRDCHKKFRHELKKGRPPKGCRRCRIRRIGGLKQKELS